MQLRREFLSFLIGYALGDSELTELTDNSQVIPMLKIKVSKMLQMTNQPEMISEEMEIFSTVYSWIKSINN